MSRLLGIRKTSSKKKKYGQHVANQAAAAEVELEATDSGLVHSSPEQERYDDVIRGFVGGRAKLRSTEFPQVRHSPSASFKTPLPYFRHSWKTEAWVHGGHHVEDLGDNEEGAEGELFVHIGDAEKIPIHNSQTS